jgi:hypothetical protein
VAADPANVRRLLCQQLEAVDSWEAFLATPLSLDPASLIPEDRRRTLDALPSSVFVLGDRVPLSYELEQGRPVVRIRLKEGQARRLRPRDVPSLDRPLRFSVLRGSKEVIRAASLEELRASLEALPRRPRSRRQHR